LIFWENFTEFKQYNKNKKMKHLSQFIDRTNGTEQDYQKWATECGIKASHSYKDRQLCEKFEVSAVAEFASWKPMNLEGCKTWKKVHDRILEECENPADLAACYLELIGDVKADYSKAGFLNENLSPFPRMSFINFGDKNWISDVSAAWFAANGVALDVQAMELSGMFGKEISVDDIIGFVRDFRKGKYKSAYEVYLKRYEERWLDWCGFRLTRKYAEHLRSILEGNLEKVEDLKAVAVPF
jgi:hypothetical protein